MKVDENPTPLDSTNQKAYDLLMVLMKDNCGIGSHTEQEITPSALNQSLYHHLHLIRDHLVPTVNIDLVRDKAYRAIRTAENSKREFRNSRR